MTANKTATATNYNFSKDVSFTYTSAFQSWDKSAPAINTSENISIPTY